MRDDAEDGWQRFLERLRRLSGNDVGVSSPSQQSIQRRTPGKMIVPHRGLFECKAQVAVEVDI
jgi:hypothetical protein